jgi:hypothetical protein
LVIILSHTKSIAYNYSILLHSCNSIMQHREIQSLMHTTRQLRRSYSQPLPSYLLSPHTPSPLQSALHLHTLTVNLPDFVRDGMPIRTQLFPSGVPTGGRSLQIGRNRLPGTKNKVHDNQNVLYMYT